MLSTFCRAITTGSQISRRIPKQSPSFLATKNMSTHTEEKIENVWDYPRPPALEKVSKRLRVVFNGETIADTTEGYRVLETSHPPVYYFPPKDLKKEYFIPSTRSTFCEWKGSCSYFSLKVGDKTAQNAVWYYPNPTERFKPIKDFVAFYPATMDACYVDDEQATAQPGDFYGGWVTKNIIGGQKGFKGGPGTWGW